MKFRTYFFEINRSSAGTASQTIKFLQKYGFFCEKPRHLTLFKVEILASDFKRLLKVLKKLLKTQTSSIFLSSSTGRSFICRNSGNQPRKFVRQ